jgi:hypothetical protein
VSPFSSICMLMSVIEHAALYENAFIHTDTTADSLKLDDVHIYIDALGRE